MRAIIITVILGMALAILALLIMGYLNAQQECEDHAYRHGVVTWFNLGTCYREDKLGNLHELKLVRK